MAFLAHFLLALGVWLALAPPAGARCIGAPAPDAAYEESLLAGEAGAAQAASRTDRTGRVVAPVTVNGRGPFRFIIDTGANRSVLSRQLADELGLAPFDEADVHTVHGVVSAPLVQVEALRFGDLTLSSAPAPLLEGGVLAGEQGLLGVDGMRGRTLRMDFERRCVEIAPSRPILRGPWTTIRGEMRFGHLLLVHGTIQGLRVNIMLDTGSNFSLANVALRDALRAQAIGRPYNGDPVVVYTAGDPVALDHAVLVPRMDMGDLRVTDVIAFVGDFHIFSLWGLDQEPTLLIGMDVLSQSRAIALDYQRANVHFRLHEPRPGPMYRINF